MDENERTPLLSDHSVEIRIALRESDTADTDEECRKLPIFEFSGRHDQYKKPQGHSSQTATSGPEN